MDGREPTLSVGHPQSQGTGNGNRLGWGVWEGENRSQAQHPCVHTDRYTHRASPMCHRTGSAGRAKPPQLRQGGIWGSSRGGHPGPLWEGTVKTTNIPAGSGSSKRRDPAHAGVGRGDHDVSLNIRGWSPGPHHPPPSAHPKRVSASAAGSVAHSPSAGRCRRIGWHWHTCP